MARGAFEVDPQEGLAEALGELDFDRLTRADFAAPSDTIRKTGTFARWGCDQFAGHGIVRLVVDQRIVEPFGYLGTSTGDETRARVIVS